MEQRRNVGENILEAGRHHIGRIDMCRMLISDRRVTMGMFL